MVNKQYQKCDKLIFPFGTNQTQYQATKLALDNRYTVIDGPPGTGKTNTILNIVANLVIEKKTVAIISSTNSAVENVYEKLEKNNLGNLMANVGSKDKTKEFNEIKKEPYNEQVQVNCTIQELTEKYRKKYSYFVKQNVKAELEGQLYNLEVEYQYIKTMYTYENNQDNFLINKLNSKLLLSHINFFERNNEVNKYLKKHFYKMDYNYLVRKSYEKKINELESKINKIQKQLAKVDIEKLNKESINVLKNETQTILESTMNFKQENFKQFIKVYPIIGSTSFSLYKLMPKDFQFDYLIIDEASQMNIYEGISLIGCSKNIIVVGDEKQFAPIVTSKKADDFTSLNLKGSFLSLFGEKIKDVSKIMLLEHYRCERSIIHFCNTFFYDNMLKIHTKSTGKSMEFIECENSKEVEKKALDQREILKDGEGIINPYKNDNSYPTVYSYQGREARSIYLTLPREEVTMYLNNPSFINVAVSRAQEKFTLVSKDFTKENNLVSDLTKFIMYHTFDERMYQKITMFDFLYSGKQYDYNPAEQKIKEEIEKILSKYNGKYNLYRRYRLKDLFINQYNSNNNNTNKVRVYKGNIELTQEEINFIKAESHVDFLISENISKGHVLSIEVDGSTHEEEKQIERDKIKDRLHKKFNADIIRLKTKHQTNELNRIKKFLD